MKRYLLYIFTVFFAVLGLVSCNAPEDRDEPTPPPGPPVTGKSSRTVLVYQIANRNGLQANSDQDFREMQTAATNGYIPQDGTLLVYRHLGSGYPYLTRVSAAGVDTLAIYQDGASSVESSRMLAVLADMEFFAPAENYGLVLWGHGTGWLQNGVEENTPMRSYGGDNGKWMNVTSLAATLRQSPVPLDYLYFDCCYMGGIEVAYELADVVPEIAFSVMEIAAEGTQYDRVVPYFFDTSEGAIGRAATATVDFYREWQEIGSRPEFSPSSFAGRYCTMSVIETANLEELAAATAAIYDRATPPTSEGRQQAYGRYPYAGLYYDFGRFVETLCFDNDGKPCFEDAASLYATFTNALAKVVTTAECMDYVFAGRTPILHYSGVSTYVDYGNTANATKYNYSQLRWAQNIAGHLKSVK